MGKDNKDNNGFRHNGTITIKWIDGPKEWYETIGPRMVYIRTKLQSSRRPDNSKYIVLEKDGVFYRAVLDESFNCTIRVKKREKHRRLYRSSVALERDTISEIKHIARTDRIPFAEAMRQVIEWGLETAANEYSNRSDISPKTHSRARAGENHVTH